MSRFPLFESKQHSGLHAVKPCHFAVLPTSYSDFLRLGHIVTIKVGTPESNNVETFWVHENLICYYSPFFDRACHGDWKESTCNIIELPEDDPDVFSLFVQRLYTGDCAYGYQGAPHVTYEKLIALYAFADKVGMLSLKDEVIDKMIELVVDGRFPIYAKQVRMVYENTFEGSGLRKMVCYVVLHTVEKYPYDGVTFLWEGGNEKGRQFAADFPDFFYDLTLYRAKESNFRVKSRNCTFHEHEYGAFCRYWRR